MAPHCNSVRLARSAKRTDRSPYSSSASAAQEAFLDSRRVRTHRSPIDRAPAAQDATLEKTIARIASDDEPGDPAIPACRGGDDHNARALTSCVLAAWKPRGAALSATSV